MRSFLGVPRYLMFSDCDTYYIHSYNLFHSELKQEKDELVEQLSTMQEQKVCFLLTSFFPGAGIRFYH